MAAGSERRVSDPFTRDCPGRTVLDHISSRWGVLILSALAPGPLRFFQLRDKVEGISDKILIQNLRLLTGDGLIERTVVPTSPPKVSYALTDLGHGLSLPLQGLIDWITEHSVDIVDARRRAAHPHAHET
ncbi:helix-turn-helix transcriptional regulator [Nonomuraea sp. K274]|uniref:Helix-turn-helix transcriptional regulator n=1 Tax=Nonomuraea cypriaca TaxID=1187855 RepID=A0A931AEL8_9ACTN|nr:helix-turn-helix domain-containing protein [Nonomuraea cypriaca]MBF8191461.1 helix-turn-helix transcriptional regulator [Nonomuraea cypriaca]